MWVVRALILAAVAVLAPGCARAALILDLDITYDLRIEVLRGPGGIVERITGSRADGTLAAPYRAHRLEAALELVADTRTQPPGGGAPVARTVEIAGRIAAPGPLLAEPDLGEAPGTTLAGGDGYAAFLARFALAGPFAPGGGARFDLLQTWPEQLSSPAGPDGAPRLGSRYFILLADRGAPFDPPTGPLPDAPPETLLRDFLLGGPITVVTIVDEATEAEDATPYRRETRLEGTALARDSTRVDPLLPVPEPAALAVLLPALAALAGARRGSRCVSSSAPASAGPRRRRRHPG